MIIWKTLMYLATAESWDCKQNESGNEDNDEKAFAKLLEEYTNILQGGCFTWSKKDLYRVWAVQYLLVRGVGVLTSEEGTVLPLIEAMSPKIQNRLLSGLTMSFPRPLLMRCLRISQNHPLLSEIKFENASTLLEYLYSTMDGRFKAHMGETAALYNYTAVRRTIPKNIFWTYQLSAFPPGLQGYAWLRPFMVGQVCWTILFEKRLQMDLRTGL